jgi:2',3'-cyclic-nucleotide 2'-phosphodiesterase (5'-nucleotidase family)
MKKLLLVMLLSFGATLCFGQGYTKAEWSRTKIDYSWENPSGKAAKVIDKYRPSVEALLLPVGKTKEELKAYPPEGKLSNLATDIMLSYGTQYLQTKTGDNAAKVDMSITNFGGIRASMPAGDVTSFDIISIFPFDNKLMILDLEGKYVRELMENFAKRGRVEAMGGVRIKIDKNVLVECTVAGEPIDDNRIYKVVTIDFLLGGGDSVYALKYARKTENCEVYMRDVVIEYIKNLSAQGKTVEAELDGRAVVIKK